MNRLPLLPDRGATEVADTNISRAGIQSFLKGKNLAFAQEDRQKRNARDEAVKAKEKRISEYRKGASKPGYLGSQDYRGFAAEFPQEAGQTATALAPAQQQQMEQLGNAWRTARALPPEQRAERAQGLIAGAVRMRITDEPTADQLSSLMAQDPERGSQVIDQIFGMEPKQRKETERDRKIQGLMDRGTPRNEAVDIVDRNLQVKLDPLSGEPFTINLATGDREAVGGAPPQAPAAPVPEGGPEKTVFDRIGEGVGFGAVVSETISRTAGQIVPSLADQETTQARTAIRGLREKLLQALAISGRPPVVEQTRLLENIPSTGVFESEPHATAQLTELHGQLSRQLMDDLTFGNNRSNPKKLREKALEQAFHIQNMLRELGSPPAGEDDFPQVTTQEDFDALPSGSGYTDPDDGKRYRKP